MMDSIAKTVRDRSGLILMYAVAMLSMSCTRNVGPLASGWSPPVQVAESKDSLVGGLNLFKRHGQIIAFQAKDDGTAKCFLMNQTAEGFSWKEVPLSGVPHGYSWAFPAMDPASDTILFNHGYMEGNQLVMHFLTGRMPGDMAVQILREKKWTADMNQIFGEPPTNARLSEAGKRSWPQIGIGVVEGPESYIPYCLSGETYSGKTVFSDQGPFSSGVFHSADSGLAWQLERIARFYAISPMMSRTRDYHYFVAARHNGGFELWFSRKSPNAPSWDAPQIITKTFANSAHDQTYAAAGADDAIHVCWVDRRHEKKRMSLVYPYRNNYEIAYCQRKDSAANWEKETILSNGLLYSYAPSIAVESNRIVVAWAGVQSAKDGHTSYSPNDIYYALSADNGQNWTKPFRLTDNTKSGITAGQPQVALLNGIIHLFYIQGKMDLKSEGGLVKLNQPPWPIYYRHRPFSH